MTYNPFFTIIVPTYNRAGLIAKTIETILAQQFQDFEIIIVDNKSTDNTVEVLQPYLNDPRIKLFVQKENYERSCSRNKGMELASGRYVTFLDSDDLLYPDSLQKANTYAIANPKQNIFHHYYEMVDTTGKIVYSFSYPPVNSNMLNRLMQGNFLACIGVFISTEIYKQYTFDENKASLGSEDWDFWIRIVADHPLGVIPEVCAAIVQHDERTVLQNKVPAIVERKKYYINKYSSNTALSAKLGKNLSVFKAGFNLYTATVAYQAKAFLQGYSYLIKGFINYPPCIFTKTFWKILLSPIKQIFIK